MGLALVTPAAEPVPLDELKLHLRVDHDEEDPLIVQLGKTAREYVEQDLHRALLESEWDWKLDGFPIARRLSAGSANVHSPRERLPWLIDYSEVLEAPLAPLRSVTSITYIDPAGDQQTLSASGYAVDSLSEPARISPAQGLNWPAARRELDAVTIRFKAGWPSAAAIPEGLKLAIKQLVNLWYEPGRDVVAERRLIPVPMGVHRLLDLFRWRHYS